MNPKVLWSTLNGIKNVNFRLILRITCGYKWLECGYIFGHNLCFLRKNHEIFIFAWQKTQS